MCELENEQNGGAGVLYLVATPIGNLEDMTWRAVRILSEVDLIAAEDTRHSRKLCAHFGISTPLTSCFAHNEAHKGEYLVQRLQQGDNLAFISDAGTPGISDPGVVLVQQCITAGIQVVPVPGASAVVTALSVSGLPTEMFTFAGFVPAKKKQRETFLQRWGTLEHTLIVYEAPHRLVACLEDICAVLGAGRELVVARELTKVHEELFRGTAHTALEHFSAHRVRGEIVLLFAPQPANEVDEDIRTTIARLLNEEPNPSVRRISKEVARQHPVSASEAYALVLEVRQNFQGT
jgi:16S rRNA (cytidine1402-2'-O)-methyltransferase